MENRKPLHEQHVKHANLQTLKNTIGIYLDEKFEDIEGLKKRLEKFNARFHDVDPTLMRNVRSALQQIQKANENVDKAENKLQLKLYVGDIRDLDKLITPLLEEARGELKRLEEVHKSTSPYQSIDEVRKQVELHKESEKKFLLEKQDMSLYLQDIRGRTERLKNSLHTPRETKVRGKTHKSSKLEAESPVSKVKTELGKGIEKINGYYDRLQNISDRSVLNQFREEIKGFHKELSATFRNAKELTQQKAFHKQTFLNESKSSKKHHPHSESHVKQKQKLKNKTNLAFPSKR